MGLVHIYSIYFYLFRSNHGSNAIGDHLWTLKQGAKNIARDNIFDIFLARASVEDHPFENSVFDEVICNGSLHLFPNTQDALIEISRTMKKNLLLTVTTFIDGDAPLIRKMEKQNTLARVFKISEFKKHLNNIGFEDFKSEIDGCFISFTA